MTRSASSRPLPCETRPSLSRHSRRLSCGRAHGSCRQRHGHAALERQPGVDVACPCRWHRPWRCALRRNLAALLCFHRHCTAIRASGRVHDCCCCCCCYVLIVMSYNFKGWLYSTRIKAGNPRRGSNSERLSTHPRPLSFRVRIIIT